ncbi:MAG: CBS domain-containing protein, partial [Phaeodactylibacter sp.]|nr:CBS domain-containing protein [Phaeodactylibacter sp.]
HLQIAPKEFTLMHNWSQLLSGPVLAVCTNSPLLFGKELWAENRIALFKQSLDTRSKRNHSRITLPRVYFGNTWCRGSALELWKKDAIRFPTLLQGFGDDDPFDLLKAGQTPKLKSIRLHNGTTYTWNRLCYGVADNSPHIRIECRYLPAGPSMADEIANFALWIGLMKSLPESMHDFTDQVDFRIAKENFLRAARYGIQSVQHWFGKNYSAKALMLDILLPMARQGLESMQVAQADIDQYLGIIERRSQSEQTGSEWQIHNFRQLTTKYKPALAGRLLVQESLQYQEANLPVHEWENLDRTKVHQLSQHLIVTPHLVEDLMQQEVLTVRDNVSVEFIRSIFSWKGFHHLPVEDSNGDLVGMVTPSMVESPTLSPDSLARDVMATKITTFEPGQSIEAAVKLMQDKNITYLSIVERDKLVGILTKSDVQEYL